MIACVGETHRETLECDPAGEHDARGLYTRARKHGEAVGGFISKNSFEELLTDRDGHIGPLETRLDPMQNPGKDKNAQHHAA